MKSFSVEFGQRSLSWKILWKFLHASSVSLLFFSAHWQDFLNTCGYCLSKLIFGLLSAFISSLHLGTYVYHVEMKSDSATYLSSMCYAKRCCEGLWLSEYVFAKETSSINLSVFPFVALPFKNMLHKLLKKSHFDNINKK